MSSKLHTLNLGGRVRVDTEGAWSPRQATEIQLGPKQPSLTHGYNSWLPLCFEDTNELPYYFLLLFWWSRQQHAVTGQKQSSRRSKKNSVKNLLSKCQVVTHIFAKLRLIIGTCTSTNRRLVHIFIFTNVSFEPYMQTPTNNLYK